MNRSRWARPDTLRVAAGLAVILVGAAAFSVAVGPARFVTYAGRSQGAATLMLATGTALVIAGLVTSLAARPPLAGDLAVLAALTWFAVPLIGWVEGPPVVRGLALVVSGFTLPLVLHLLVALHPPWGGGVRAAVAIAYSEAVIVGLALTFFRDPYFDSSCFANCTTNPFLILSSPGLVRIVGEFHTWFLAGVGVVLTRVAVSPLVSIQGSARRQSLLAAVPGALLGVVVIAAAVIDADQRPQDPFDDVLFGLFVATAAGLLLLAAGLLGAAALHERRRRALSRLITDLAGIPAFGGLEAALREAVDDPHLQLAYPVAGSGSLVDANGQQVSELVSDARLHRTTLTRGSVPIAVVTHSGTLLHPKDKLGSSVLMGLENERLQAEILARLEELRASRERIVEAGDRERQRLERDLHDGAQQSMLALSYDVRLAGAAAEAGGDELTLSTLRRASEMTHEVLQDLRELARGIFPSVLVEVGLEAALRSYADLAAIPVQVRSFDLDRHPGPVESAAYFGVVEAVEDASLRAATVVLVSIHQDQDRLVIDVDDDGTPRTSPMIGLVDRVGALGGTAIVEPTACRLGIPCA